uniref:OSJNBa0024J22.20 protein n=2 Tax=Oryza sativa TaxID=4530 RepID=Q7XXL9_ORYSJ|nr:OSJNBa0024J22.20 [Oryza sativa Japonica Group]CAE75900.1 OSJNBa0033H08.19 [Oryza sativa Japonica Group]CAH66605.1 H0211A12.8 [Oryza sativa]
MGYTHEIVVFTHFFYGDFALPTTKFFRGILEFYGINIYHLNPNSIVHIANFVHLFEAFLGIRPHFALIRRIFFLKPQPNKNKPCIVGGSSFQLHGTLCQKYFTLPLKTSNKGWHASWFYIQNPDPALPEYSCCPHKYQDIWNSLPMGEESAQALELLDRLLKLKEQGLQGEQITQHFIKCRLALIKEWSRTAFEYDGKNDQNQEDPDSIEYKIMKERMYKVFSYGIVLSFSHLLLVVPYNAFNPPPVGCSREEEEDIQRPMPKIRRSFRKPSYIDPTGKGTDPAANSETAGEEKTGSTDATKADTSKEKPPTGSQSATGEADADNELPTGNQSASAETSTNQEPLTGNQPGEGTEDPQRPHWDEDKDIPETEEHASSPPLNQNTDAGPEASTFDKVEGPAWPPPKIITGPMIGDEEEILRIKSTEDSQAPILGIVINKKKEYEEVALLTKTLNQATRLVNRIHHRNEAKTATLERLVPHLDTLEETRAKLHATKEEARRTEHALRDQIAELQDANFELSVSSKVQAAKISELERRIKVLENDKAALSKERDLAVKEFEDHKGKTKAQFNFLINKVEVAEKARDEVANTTTPIIQAMYLSSSGTSSLDVVEIFNKLRTAPDVYFKNIKEARNMGASMALAMTKSLYPKIDVDAIDGFAARTSEEDALYLINDA